MALYYDLPVYRDTYQLILKVFECTGHFPKEYKYSLGQDMKRDALQLVRSIESERPQCAVTRHSQPVSSMTAFPSS